MKDSWPAEGGPVTAPKNCAAGDYLVPQRAGPHDFRNRRAGVDDHAPRLPDSIDDGALDVIVTVNEDFDFTDVRDQ